MGEDGPQPHADRIGLDVLKKLTLSERWQYLLGASLFFLLGTLAVDTLLFGIVIPEVLFVAGWVYLAGASTDDRTGRAHFKGSAVIAAATSVAYIVFVLSSDSPWSGFALFLGPYFPLLYVTIIPAQAMVFVYLATSLAVPGRRPSVLIVLGSIAIVVVAMVGLFEETSEYVVSSVFFMPIGYALIALGAWVESRRLREPAEPGLVSASRSPLGPP